MLISVYHHHSLFCLHDVSEVMMDVSNISYRFKFLGLVVFFHYFLVIYMYLRLTESMLGVHP